MQNDTQLKWGYVLLENGIFVAITTVAVGSCQLFLCIPLFWNFMPVCTVSKWLIYCFNFLELVKCFKMIIKQLDICFYDKSPVCFPPPPNHSELQFQTVYTSLAEHYTHIRREVSYDICLYILLRLPRFSYI